MNQKTISLEKFLLSGTLADLACGMTKSDVTAILGMPQDPKDVEDYPRGKSLIAYFPVEFRFYNDLVSNIGIGFTWWDGVMSPCFKVEGFFPRATTKMAEIHAFLADHKIPFECGKDPRQLRTSAGVWLFPTSEEDDTIMTVAIDSGPTAYFDNHFRKI